MNPLSALFATLLASAVPSQNIGLTVELPTFPPQVIGQICGGVRCASPFGPPPPTAAIARGARGRFVVHGAVGQIFFLAVSDTAGCQRIQGIQNPLVLGGMPGTVSIGAVGAPAAFNVCGGQTGRTGTWVTVPGSIPSGSQFVFQALTLEPIAGGTQLAFTNQIVVLVQ